MTVPTLPRPPSPAWTTDRALTLGGVLTLFAGTFTILEAEALLSPLGALLLPAGVFGTWLAFAPRPWTYLAAGLSVLPLALSFPGFTNGAPGLREPLASREFVASLLLTLSILLGPFAGVRGFIRTRLGTGKPLRTRSVDPTFAVVTVLVGVILGASITSVLAVEQAASWDNTAYDLAPDARFVLRAQDMENTRPDIVLQAGVLTELVVVNDDSVLHTLTYIKDGRTQTRELLPDTTTRILVRFDSPAEYAAWCARHMLPQAENTLSKIVVT